MRTRMTGQLVAVAGLLAALTGAHWNGTRWRSIPVPVTVSGIDTIRQDGHGGIWLLADAKGGDLAQYWYHYSDGGWTRQLVPTPRGYNTTLFGMAWIPGTTSIWAVGEADSNRRAVGVVARYGP
jgi:hypothetical protein